MTDTDISSILGNLAPKRPSGVSRPSAPAARPAVPEAPIRQNLSDRSASFHSQAPLPTADPSAAPVRPPREPMEVVTEDRDTASTQRLSLDDMLEWMLVAGGSDLFLSANLPPSSKIHGERVAVDGYGPLTGAEIEQLVFSIVDNKQRQKFEETKELDCSYSIPGKSRFRVNVFRSKGDVSAVMRTIPFEIKPISALGLPLSLNDYSKLPRGLVLVTGPTGSGKSTTLAAILDEINRTQKGHILTIEDPIEFVHGHRGCIVNQREVGADTESFANALKAALREAPDYILVGEMRDYETISLAITLAETGHLVFGTLHTNSAPETISRIVDVFPSDQQEQVKTQLASTLQAVVCQNLIRTKDGNGRVAAVEIMNTNQSVKSKIRKGQLESLVSDMQTGERYGMQTMDSHLEALAKEGKISKRMAVEKAHRPRDLMEIFGGEEALDEEERRGRR